MGRPMGIAAGVLTLAFLRGGLNGLGIQPAAQDIVTGSILMAVAIADGTATRRRIADLFARKPAPRRLSSRVAGPCNRARPRGLARLQGPATRLDKRRGAGFRAKRSAIRRRVAVPSAIATAIRIEPVTISCAAG